jgi:hypothetical protein
MGARARGAGGGGIPSVAEPVGTDVDAICVVPEVEVVELAVPSPSMSPQASTPVRTMASAKVGQVFGRGIGVTY